MNFEHVSVMLMPTVDMLNVREGGIYVDGTLGGGGHSAEILRRLNGTGHLYGIDRAGGGDGAPRRGGQLHRRQGQFPRRQGAAG